MTTPGTTLPCERWLLPELDDEQRNAWRELATHLGANFSLYPEWVKVATSSHGTFEEAAVLVAGPANSPSAVIPYCIQPVRKFGLPVRQWTLASNFVSYHNQILSTLDTEETLGIIVNEASARGAQVVHLAGLQDDLAIVDALRHQAETGTFTLVELPESDSPFLRLPDTWDELIADKAKKFRYKLRKRAESLENDDRLAMRWYPHDVDRAELLRAMRVVEDRSWKKEAGVALFDRDYERQYHELLLPVLETDEAVFANLLYLDGKPIAYNLCCHWQRWVGQLKTSFDLEYADLSPGALVIDEGIRYAIEQGANEFDFLGDRDRHKLSWTKTSRPHVDMFLYLPTGAVGKLLALAVAMRSRLS